MKRFSLLLVAIVLVSFHGTADAKGPLRNAVRKSIARPLASAVFSKGTRGHAGSSDPYARALASATERAEKRIRGHLDSLEFPAVMESNRIYRSGVGFSETDPNPPTCLGVPGKTNAVCAVVRGADGWYSTCVR